MSGESALPNLSIAKAEPSPQVWIPILFLIFLFLTGGGSRSDIASLPLLRGISMLAACWAATRMESADWHRIRVPLLLMVTLIFWMIIQLIPLPPAVWHNLSGREAIVTIDRLLGQAGTWRPISLTPSLTMNSLLAMVVPVAAMLVAAQTKLEEYSRFLTAIVAIGCVSGLLGFVQILSGPSSGAYLYRITNADTMVGLFANRNHHAIFLACVVVIAGMLLRDELMRKRKRKLFQGGMILAGLFLTSMTVLIGSRAGLVAGVVAFGISYAMAASAWHARSAVRAGNGMAPLAASTRLFLYAPPLLLVLILLAIFWVSSRTTSLGRMVDNDVVADLRVQAWPTVQSMVDTYWLTGSGFGSFSEVYKMFEPDSLLQPNYFNHAHNDWVELLITGGAPFVLIILLGILWVARRFSAHNMRNLLKGYRGDMRLPVLTIAILLAVASMVDYPLRIPSLQAMAILLIIFLCCPKPTRTYGD